MAELLHRNVRAGNRNPTRTSPSGHQLYLSVVLTSRNQNQAGQHTRLSHALKSIADNCVKYGLKHMVELLLIDYNSLPDLPTLDKVRHLLHLLLQPLLLLLLIDH